MLKLAILKPIERNDSGQIIYKPIIEGQDGEFENEMCSLILEILGPKDSYKKREIVNAVSAAFNRYKTKFKERSVIIK